MLVYFVLAGLVALAAGVVLTAGSSRVIVTPKGSAPIPQGTATPQVSKDGYWLSPRSATSFAKANSEWMRRHGKPIPLASAGRTMAADVKLAGFYGGHAAGDSIDVSFGTLDARGPWSRDELDTVLAMFDPPFRPLINRPADPNHYQTVNYAGDRTTLNLAIRQVGNWDETVANA